MLETISIIFGFTITGLGIIFNPVVTSKINKMQREQNKKLDEFAYITDSVNRELTKSVNSISSDIKLLGSQLSNHNTFIQHQLGEKETLNSLRFIVDDALKYVEPDPSIRGYILHISDVVIQMVNELLDIGIDNLTTDMLVNKQELLQKRLYDEVSYVNQDFLKAFKKLRLKQNYKKTFVDDILEISSDVVNSKRERFRVTIEGYMQRMIRDIIVTWNKQKQIQNYVQ